MDDSPSKSDLRPALLISDPSPVASVPAMWAAVSQAALIGIFLILFGTFLYFGRPLVLPILAAAVVALTLAPGVKMAADRGCPPVITALIILLLALGAISLVTTAIAGPVSAWIGRAPEIGANLKQKLMVFDAPLAALHQLQASLFGDTGSGANAPAANVASNVVVPVVAFITPAAGEMLLFLAMLFFFLVGQREMRSSIVAMFASRDAKLRFLKIMRDIERNLAGYLAVVTAVNCTLGVIVALGAWLIGLPNPAIFGVLAAVFNYVPYIGPAIMVIVLFGVGLVTFPSLSHALIAPLSLVAITTAEGHFITPTIVGRRLLTLNPLLLFLALAFWTWMWGPIGAFLAVPLSIIGLVIANHLIPDDDVHLPD